MPNGHSENGNSGYESPQPESPGPSSTPSKAPEPMPRKAPEPESPEPSPAPSPVKADIIVDGIDKEADTSKESVEDGREISNEPPCGKKQQCGFQTGLTQTCLYSYRSS